jgi:lysozyme family protein
MSDFTLAIGPLLEREGSVFTANDNGRGACKYGVTLSSYREIFPNAMAVDIQALNVVSAGEFYLSQFWGRYHVGLLDDQGVADKVMDLAVNCGGSTAVKMLQRVIGVPVDGILGPDTAGIANTMQPDEVIGALRIAAAKHYQDLVVANPTLAVDLTGWLARNQSV